MRAFTTFFVLMFALGYILFMHVPVVYAGDFEKGAMSYKSGKFAEAARLWHKAAEQGNVNAQRNLDMTLKEVQKHQPAIVQ